MHVQRWRVRRLCQRAQNLLAHGTGELYGGEKLLSEMLVQMRILPMASCSNACNITSLL
jgi:hypothetical protein